MIHTFIRAFRKRHGISQEDLADILQVSRAMIDRTEAGQQRPTLDLAFRLQVAFGAEPRQMFPEAFARIEERVMRSAKERYDGLQERTGKRASALRAFIEAMPERASAGGITVSRP